MIKLFIDKQDFLIYYFIKVNMAVTLQQISEKLQLSKDYVSMKIKHFVENKIPLVYDTKTEWYSFSADSKLHFSVSIGDEVYNYDEDDILNDLVNVEERESLLLNRI